MNARAGVMVIAAETPLTSAIMAALRDTRGVEHVVGVDTAQIDLASRRVARDLLFSHDARGVDTIVHVPGQHAASDDRCDCAGRTVHELLTAAEEAPGIERFVLCSSAAVYRLTRDQPRLIGENEPLDLASPSLWSRSAVACDVAASTRIAGGQLRIVVLRCAEILAPSCGGQLYDYLSSRVCLRPLGYDPMVNVLSLDDAARAVALAATSSAAGVFNVPGRDTLPLSELVHHSGRIGLPLPGPLLGPLYRARSSVTGGRFRYGRDQLRFHYGAILDGRKAAQVLGYVPQHAAALATLFRS